MIVSGDVIVILIPISVVRKLLKKRKDRYHRIFSSKHLEFPKVTKCLL